MIHASAGELLCLRHIKIAGRYTLKEWDRNLSYYRVVFPAQGRYGPNQGQVKQNVDALRPAVYFRYEC